MSGWKGIPDRIGKVTSAEHKGSLRLSHRRRYTLLPGSGTQLAIWTTQGAPLIISAAFA
jgi:hypothetical protein